MERELLALAADSALVGMLELAQLLLIGGAGAGDISDTSYKQKHGGRRAAHLVRMNKRCISKMLFARSAIHTIVSTYGLINYS